MKRVLKVCWNFNKANQKLIKKEKEDIIEVVLVIILIVVLIVAWEIVIEIIVKTDLIVMTETTDIEIMTEEIIKTEMMVEYNFVKNKLKTLIFDLYIIMNSQEKLN